MSKERPTVMRSGADVFYSGAIDDESHHLTKRTLPREIAFCHTLPPLDIRNAQKKSNIRMALGLQKRSVDYKEYCHD